MRIKRPRHRGFGEYHQILREKTEARVLKYLDISSHHGFWVSIRNIRGSTGIEMKTLRKTLSRLKNKGILTEVKGIRNSKLYCLDGAKDNIDYWNMVRDAEPLVGTERAREMFSDSFTLNENGFMVRN